MSIDYDKRQKQERFEYSVLIVLSTLGMLMLISAADLIALYLGLELMSLPLYVVAASHRTSLRSTEAGSQIFRARRAVVGNAALRSLAGLRLHRHGEFRRHRPFRGGCRLRIDLRAGVSVRRLLLQGLGGAVPYVDAGRLRRRADAGDGVFRRRAQGGRHRHVRPRCGRGLSRHHRAMAGNRRLCFDCLDAARLVRRHRPAQYQAADGLFLDRPYGLCADRACRRHVGRRAGRAGLYGDLSDHDARRVRRDPVDAARTAAWWS